MAKSASGPALRKGNKRGQRKPSPTTSPKDLKSKQKTQQSKRSYPTTGDIIYQTREPKKKHFISLLVWERPGGLDVFGVLPPNLVGNTRMVVRLRPRAGNWRSCEPRYASSIESAALWAHYHESSFRRKRSRGNDGLPGTRSPRYFAAQKVARTSKGSSSSGSTRGAARGRSVRQRGSG